MADFRFLYTKQPDELDALREEGIFCIREVNKKLDRPDTDAERIYNMLYGANPMLLVQAYEKGYLVGLGIQHVEKDLYWNTEGCVVDMFYTQTTGVLKAYSRELDELASLEGWDFVRFHTSRKGFLKKMKMGQGGGYKVSSYIVEKDYGRQRS